ncbi:YveK family protein [Salisediminibacterium halotolerans]|uniref:YveK family protein n=1 Tax=Salisediminibacterium halotolerans TaxID=517425 RepID=UPI000EB26980|nr:Wzz/FepE/Etk N-terminal domain-containing protein [Salisediminibacterium halotolerans]RLJ75730.1 capsular polysaccharide biosynthesis protein [Actinophytocola xinjiangensis]RPE89584.1 capsular polysaccharide biosynthesis protein [Salisediminibacterium halotolerans]TWG36343.1 capsular polysaccharide biosynthesis protein [Salisediminibacterium halotolerans]GEL07208.1 putative capsular polysaccharide biosynthesis protein YwqC [Salisediminibacterium halotolerans]
MEETISLSEIMETLKKRIGMIILITVGAVAAAGIISYFFLTPMYEQSTQILINEGQQEGEIVRASDITTNQDLIETYNVIMQSPRILEPTLEELGMDQSVSQLRDQVTVQGEGESQVVTVTVEDESPADAVNIANTLAATFQEDVVEIMNVDNVSILSAAELSDDPSPASPNPTLNMAIAFVVGLMAAVGLAFLLDFLDKTVRTEEDIEKHLGVPILASISTIDATSVNTQDLENNESRSVKRGRNQHGA